MQCIFICANCSIREYKSDFSPSCWHNMPAYYALNYAGIFDRGLIMSQAENILTDLEQFVNHTINWNSVHVVRSQSLHVCMNRG